MKQFCVFEEASTCGSTYAVWVLYPNLQEWQQWPCSKVNSTLLQIISLREVSISLTSIIVLMSARIPNNIAISDDNNFNILLVLSLYKILTNRKATWPHTHMCMHQKKKSEKDLVGYDVYMTILRWKKSTAVFLTLSIPFCSGFSKWYKKKTLKWDLTFL